MMIMEKDKQWLPGEGEYETFTEFGLAELTGESSMKQRVRVRGQHLAKTAYLLNNGWPENEVLSCIFIEHPLEDTCLRY